jgi:CHAT domain-containing protein
MSIWLAQGQLLAQDDLARQAQTLTTQGQELLDRGQPQEALESWKAATRLYQQLKRTEGITGSYINQSLALWSLGLYPQACQTLTQAFELPTWVCQSSDSGSSSRTNELRQQLRSKPSEPLAVQGWHRLGDVLRKLGKLDESEVVLEEALQMSESVGLDAVRVSELRLSLANTERLLYKRAISTYQITSEPLYSQQLLTTIQEKVKKTLELYQQAELGNPLLARLNRFSLLVEMKQWDIPLLKPFQEPYISSIEPLKQFLLTASFEQLPPGSVQARLNFASALLEMGDLPNSERVAQTAHQVAQKLNSPRLISQAEGTWGKIARRRGQPEAARLHLESALNLAQAVRSYDEAYQWQWELGRIHRDAGRTKSALAAYQAAINHIDRLRGNVLATNPDFQFSFTEKIEPVYREYLGLLASAPQPDLKALIATHEKLKLVELENFLQCDRLNLVPLETIDRLPPIIHLIDLKEGFLEIVRSPDGELHLVTPNPMEVRSARQSLLLNLQDDNFLETPESLVLKYPQTLYQELIAPIQKYLPATGTLVFVLDSSWQNVPMAMLHDGRDYLLDRYHVALTIGSLVRPPSSLAPEQLRALIGGLWKAILQYDLPAMPQIKTEVAAVRANTLKSKELLNEDFTQERLFRESRGFPLVHLTTHGQFSSAPERTFLLAWDKPINVREFARWVSSKGESVELLTLSACETAKGDRRSVLGLAGMATQVGARSTVATLWLVDVAPTARLMEKFYTGLKQGLTKAEALSNAQRELRQSYPHPYFWAGVVLVGGWL